MRLVRGSESWEIWHEGTMVRLDGGALRRFQSVRQAGAAYEAAIAARRDDGFVDAPDVVDDLDARLVYADELQLKGDPLGELIAVQHAHAHQRTGKLPVQIRRLERRVHALLEDHHDALFGSLASFVRRPSRSTPARPALQITWRSGFADEVRIQRAPKLELHDLWSQLRKLPISRFMTKLVVGSPTLPSPYLEQGSYRQLLSTIAKDGAPAHLRTLVLGDIPLAQRVSLDLGDLRPVVESCLDLQHLEVKRGMGILGPLVSTSLQRLVLENIAEPLRDVPRSSLPALSELSVINGYGTVLLRLLLEVPLLDQLSALTLRRCHLQDPDLDSIRADADRFGHLTRLDLRDNDFSRDAVRQARLRLPRLKA
ncbi:MAG: hypothetical protein H0T89_33830 [Deltaproteobacteria bacterium]|nr:hypothetical protein [Deltaproteobacteria bacterium]